MTTETMTPDQRAIHENGHGNLHGLWYIKNGGKCWAGPYGTGAECDAAIPAFIRLAESRGKYDFAFGTCAVQMMDGHRFEGAEKMLANMREAIRRFSATGKA